MSPGTLIYLAAMALIYVGERLLGGYDSFRWIFIVAGIAGLGGAIALRLRHIKEAEDAGLKIGHRRLLDLLGIAVVSLVIYALSTDAFVSMVGFTGEMALRWTGVFGAIWPIVWAVATIPMIVVDNALYSSPVVIPARHVSRAFQNSLAVAFAICLVFPVNYLASKNDQRWDFSYFRTSEAGTATQAVVKQLEEPIDVRIFQPVSSDVAQELQDYFAQLKSPNLRVQLLDQAAHPLLARELRVRDNGYIAISKGEIDLKPDDAKDPKDAKKEKKKKPEVQIVKVGKTMDDAREKLKTLDQEVQKALLGMARGQLTACVTEGHNELAWSSKSKDPMKSAEGFKQVLEFMNFRIQKVGGKSSLAEAIDEKCDVLVMLGPEGLLPAEADGVKSYLRDGGSLLVGIEPAVGRRARVNIGEDGGASLYNFLGVEFEDGLLCQDRKIVPMTKTRLDRANIGTDRFSVHPSTTVLSENRGQLSLFVPTSGALKEVKGGDAKITPTVRSLDTSWLDRDGNYTYDAGAAESKTSRTIAVASEGSKDGGGWKAIAIADAGVFADIAIINPGNQQFVHDGLNWLTGQEAFSGTVKNEEDVRIQHTKEGQAGWFYLTSVLLPLMLFGFGAVRVNMRRKGGES